MKCIKKNIPLITLLLLVFSVKAQQTETISLSPENLVEYGISAKSVTYKGKKALELVQKKDTDFVTTFAVLKNIDFHNGTIEVCVSGEPKKGAISGARGFVGISFRVTADTNKFETFYIRPTNARSNEQERRNHSLQYISHPGFPWELLRKQTPERYESYADLIAGEWTKLKIEVNNDIGKLYVNDAQQPNLIVNDLKQGNNLHGSIALWIAIGTRAYFADLKIINKD